MGTRWTTFCDTLRRFGRAREGNIAVIFALTMVPVIASIGAAVDYSRANSVKADMQAALDATALMLSKQAATATVDQLQANATAYFKALFNRPGSENIAVTASYNGSNGSTLVVNAAVDVPTEFMQAFGYDTVTLTGSSTTQWGTTRLRVALALDNTGSMSSDGKMDALKTATANLLTQLKDAVTNAGDVYVSIVPFVKDVNLGAANYQANWLDWTDWEANNGNCSGYSSWKKPRSKSSCLYNGGTWTPADRSTWNGCVVDRGDTSGPSIDGYDTNVTAPTSSITATLYAAEQYGSCPQAARGLSYDWDAMNTLVSNMRPSGSTNQAIGL